MDLGLRGKLALVTGANRGLGHAAAEALGQEGARLVVLGRDPDATQDAVSGFRARGMEASGVCADLTVPADVASAFDRVRTEHGSPDILVYNNGGARDLDFDQASDEDFRHAYEILVMGFIWCVREVLPEMKRRGWGRVVTLGSLCVREPHREFPLVLHNLGRPAQVGLSKTLSNEVGRHGITLNTIATGTIDHDGDSVRRAYAAAEGRGLSRADVQARRIGDVPAGRPGRPDELGSLCAFLCSDRAGYINGQTILLDGGRTRALM